MDWISPSLEKEATWNFGTNILTIGAISSDNGVSVSNNADVVIDNIYIGSASTTNNRFIVTDRARVQVNDGINIFGGTNALVRVEKAGILAVDFDFDASVGVDLAKGGILEAHRNLTFGGITNGGGVIMNGPNANWSNLSASSLDIGNGSDQNFLVVSNGATVRVGSINLGSITNVDNRCTRY